MGIMNKVTEGKPRLELVPGWYLRRHSSAYAQLVDPLFDRSWDDPRKPTEGLIQGINFTLEEIERFWKNAAVNPVEALLSARMDGIKKYAEYDWLLGGKWSAWVGAARRHLVLGQVDMPHTGSEVKRAPDSNVWHIAHAQCSLVFLRDYVYNNWPTDDRQDSLEAPRAKKGTR
jgi:hypothetical protein